MKTTGIDVGWGHKFSTVQIRVLALDDDCVSLFLLEELLKKCGYQVTLAVSAMSALELLREKSDNFDLIISDVHMPDIDGFKFLEIVGLEMDLPVIMLSADSDNITVMKGIRHGACDYLVKPVRLENVKLIWKHVFRRSFAVPRYTNEHSTNLSGLAKSSGESSKKLISKRHLDRWKEVEDDSNDSNSDEDGDISMKKRPRVSWSTSLHNRFIEVVQRLGVDRAVPKKILDLMNEPDLTRENVASHLQKYRKSLKKNALEVNQRNNSQNNLASFGTNSAGYNSFSFRHNHPTHFNGGISSAGSPSHHGTLSLGHIPRSQETSLFPLFSNLRNNVQQHLYSLNPQVSQLKGHGYNYGSNSLRTDSLRDQLEINNVRNQSFDKASYNLDSYFLKHQSIWPHGQEQEQSYLPPLDRDFNEKSIDFLVERTEARAEDFPKEGFNDSLKAILQNIEALKEVEAARDGVNLENESPGEESFTRACSTDLDAEALFQLNYCSYAEDLQTAVKQFQK